MPDLNDRQRRILARLVGEYIEQGEPISSAWLAEHSELGLSSATVRTILMRLEEQGLVHQPHTSAGRVPTDSGYRLYVDGLLGSRKRPRSLPDVEARLRRAGTVSDMLENASQELSRASHQVAFALASASATMRLQHIDFVNLETGACSSSSSRPADKSRTRSSTRKSATRRCSHQAANFINAEFAGLTLHEARTAIVDGCAGTAALRRAHRERAAPRAAPAWPTSRPRTRCTSRAHRSWSTGLIGDPADRQRMLETLRALLRMIEEKHRLVALLTQIHRVERPVGRHRIGTLSG